MSPTWYEPHDGVAPPKNRLLIDCPPISRRVLFIPSARAVSATTVPPRHDGPAVRRPWWSSSRTRPICWSSDAGPSPAPVSELISLGHTVTAIEPCPDSSKKPNDTWADADVQQARRTDPPRPAVPSTLYSAESILEHVGIATTEPVRDLPRAEAGGAAWITTTNRWDFTISGRNGEFNDTLSSLVSRSAQEALSIIISTMIHGWRIIHFGQRSIGLRTRLCVVMAETPASAVSIR